MRDITKNTFQSFFSGHRVHRLRWMSAVCNRALY